MCRGNGAPANWEILLCLSSTMTTLIKMQSTLCACTSSLKRRVVQRACVKSNNGFFKAAVTLAAVHGIYTRWSNKRSSTTAKLLKVLPRALAPFKAEDGGKFALSNNTAKMMQENIARTFCVVNVGMIFDSCK